MSASSSSSSSSGGIGFFGALAILFIALKLLGFIDWSWWWVLSPLWGMFVFVIIILLSILSFVVAADNRQNKRIREQQRKRL